MKLDEYFGNNSHVLLHLLDEYPHMFKDDPVVTSICKHRVYSTLLLGAASVGDFQTVKFLAEMPQHMRFPKLFNFVQKIYTNADDVFIWTSKTSCDYNILRYYISHTSLDACRIALRYATKKGNLYVIHLISEEIRKRSS